MTQKTTVPGLGRVLTSVLPGTTPDLLLEILPYRRPHWPTAFRNLRLRVEGFLKEAIPVVLVGVLIVNLLYWLGFFDGLARAAAPLMTRLLGLPKETFAAVAVGFLRKDMAMGPAGDDGLNDQAVGRCQHLAVDVLSLYRDVRRPGQRIGVARPQPTLLLPRARATSRLSATNPAISSFSSK